MSAGGPATGGKPTVLTPEVRKRILEALRVGSPRGAAAARAGVGARTLREWMARTDDVEPFASFRAEVEEAEGLCELQLAGVAFKGALNNPALAMRFLAMRFPGTWGRRPADKEQPAELTGADDIFNDPDPGPPHLPPWKRKPAPEKRPFWEENEPSGAGERGREPNPWELE